MTDGDHDELVAAAARVAGIEIPNADFPSLTAAYANQLAAIAALETVDASELEPVVTMDPRWK
jgi:hypothetical protein